MTATPLKQPDGYSQENYEIERIRFNKEERDEQGGIG
jgi:hypothetical protein